MDENTSTSGVQRVASPVPPTTALDGWHLEERDNYLLSGSRLGGPLFVPWDMAVAPAQRRGCEWQLLAQLVLDEDQALRIGKQEPGALMWLYDPTEPFNGASFHEPGPPSLLWVPEASFDTCVARETPSYEYSLVAEPQALAMLPATFPLVQLPGLELSELYRDDSGHNFFGPAAFTQTDPREALDDAEDWVHLWQLDTSEHVMFGDCGIAHQFLRRADLDAGRVERSWFHWDCC